MGRQLPDIQWLEETEQWQGWILSSTKLIQNIEVFPFTLVLEALAAQRTVSCTAGPSPAHLREKPTRARPCSEPRGVSREADSSVWWLQAVPAGRAAAAHSLLGAGRLSPGGRAGAGHPGGRALPSAAGCHGQERNTNHLPCPACLVNTAGVRSLMNTALLCSHRHSTQPAPSKGDGSASTHSLSHKGGFSATSDCYSTTDPRVNKMPKPFNFRYDFSISSPQDEEQPTQCQAEAHELVFPCLPPFPLGLTELFQGLSPSPSWILSTPDVPEGSSRGLWHHW